MSEPAKPLHVRVAEALGWKGLHPTSYEGDTRVFWWGSPPGTAIQFAEGCWRYDTSWTATGPLIEKYKLDIVWDDDSWRAYWDGGDDGDMGIGVYAATPLVALCNLILELGEAGKL